MKRHVLSVFLLVFLPAVGRAVELEKVHPDERAAVAALQKVYDRVELNLQGRVTRLHVPVGGTLGDEHMPLVASLRQLEHLDLANARVSDKGLNHLKRLPRLRVLRLPESLRRAFETMSENCAKAFRTFEQEQDDKDGSGSPFISDAGLAHLAELRQLEELGLRFTWTSDEGLKSLANLTKLRKLDLAATEVTNAGMARLRHFDRLTHLVLDDTDVGDAGLMRLTALPDLESLSLKQTLASYEVVSHLRTHLPRLQVTPEILPIRRQVEAVRALRYADVEVELDDRGRAVRVSNPRKEDVYDLGVLVRVFAELQGIEDNQEREQALRTLGREMSLSRIRPLPALTTLKELDLKGLALENDDLALLSNLIELRRLDLSHTDITDEALGHLARLSKLETLELAETNTTFGGVMELLVATQERSVPEALAVVGQATLDADGSITELDVRRPHVTDHSIKYLKQLTMLTDLDLSECDISDTGLIQVAEFAHVRSLNLKGKPVSDVGVAHLAGMTELRKLVLADTRVTDRGTKHIAGMTQLEVLNLDGTDVTDAGILTLASLGSLDTLTLRDTLVSQEAVEKLRATIPNLAVEPRTLPKAQIVEHVAAIRRDGVWFSYDREGELVTVLFDQSATTDDDLQSLAKIKTLKQLSLKGDLISEDGVSHLTQLTNLDHLEARGVPVTNPMLKHFGRLTHLKWLSLIDTKVDDRGLGHLNALSNLEWLGLSGTNVTDAGLPHLEKLGGLDRLDLRDTRVTDEGVKKLQQALPKCEIEH